MKRILMLGWEYPPHISGGLGTACEGLTKAMAHLGAKLTFIVPHLFGDERGDHMLLLDPYSISRLHDCDAGELSRSINRIQIPAFLKPYWTKDQFQQSAAIRKTVEQRLGARSFILQPSSHYRGPVQQYGTDMQEEVGRFTSAVVNCALDLEFDVIHAHDWMTYPAGMALAEILNKPLVVHVHSLEYDRSGEHVDPRIFEVERAGVTRADIVVAVSHYTKGVIERVHGVPRHKLRVVYNGIYPKQALAFYRRRETVGTQIVLFLGRITFQKGPNYFVEAAAQVVSKMPGVLFVMAGSGDLLPHLQRRVYELGIQDYFYFPGFLRGRQVDQMFTMADLYVMPSVSEPFGLSALEAINFDTPVLISKQSGVSEVLSNALKFDFWDINFLAKLMMKALSDGQLRKEMVTLAKRELEQLRWEVAAERVLRIYQEL